VDVDQVLDRLEDDVESAFDNLNAHLAAVGDRDGVGVDHPEALLEDRFLTAGGGDFLLAVIAVEILLEDRVNHEARSDKSKAE